MDKQGSRTAVKTESFGVYVMYHLLEQTLAKTEKHQKAQQGFDAGNHAK